MDKNIVIYKNAIDNELLNYIVKNSQIYGDWQTSQFITNNSKEINTGFRNSSEIWAERTHNLTNIRDSIEPILRSYIDSHPLTKNNPDYILYEMRVLRYNHGDFLLMHSDNPKLLKYSQDRYNGIQEHLIKNATYRWLTLCLYLSDFIGGELSIKDKTVWKPEKNSLILFPGVLPEYSHQSLPVSSGTKYVLTTWACS